MCIHEFYLSTACGHHFPKVPPSAKPNAFFNNFSLTIAVPQSLTCAPVKLALKFYHDQVVYLPADMNCGAKVELPKRCPIVHSSPNSPTKRTIRENQKARDQLNQTMLRNGLGPWQQWQIEIDAAKLDQCSKRETEPNNAALQRHKVQRYPPNMFAHVQNVKAFQDRDKRHMVPNVKYFDVEFGCGGPFSAKCLTGWDVKALLMHRLHHWSDKTIHPKPCDNECLRGWSGADLDTYRQQTWPRRNNGEVVDYSKSALRYDFSHHEGWVNINYNNISHLHADQWYWDGKEFVRRCNPEEGKEGPEVEVPEEVCVPVSKRLYQALYELSLVPVPGSPFLEEVDWASIEDILGRLPEAFDEQEPLSREVSQPSVYIPGGSESASTLVDEPAAEPEPIVEETPEMADARRRKAREVMREKLKRDFSKGKGKAVVEEG